MTGDRPEVNRIYIGDCLDVMRSWPDASFNTVLADPPYNIGYGYNSFKDNLPLAVYEAQQYSLVVESLRLLHPGGAMLYLNLPEFCADLWAAARGIQGLVRWDMMFWTQNGHTTNPSSRLPQNSRAWLWFVKDGAEPTFNREAVRDEYRNADDPRIVMCQEKGIFPVWRDFFQFEPVKNVSADKTEHPCQLPVRMVQGLVGMTTPAGGVILDPYMGSGTTAVAAVCGRFHYVGIEIDEHYRVLAEERLALELAQEPLL